MQRIAGMSVIVKADGVSEAFYNGQRDRVVEAVRAAAEAEVKKERDRADFQERVSNRLRAANMKAFQQSQRRKAGPLKRIGNAAAMGWAYAWGTAFVIWKKFASAVEWAWIWLWVILYGLKLVEYVGDEE